MANSLTAKTIDKPGQTALKPEHRTAMPDNLCHKNHMNFPKKLIQDANKVPQEAPEVFLLE